MGLDTVSGLLRIVVNGLQVVNEKKEYFRNTTHWKPKSLDEKLIVFKGYWGGFWYQYRSTFSNMNIFSEYSNPPTTIPYEQTKDQADYLMTESSLT